MLVQKSIGMSFPWGTFAVNSLGCLSFGIVWSATGGRSGMSDEVRLIVLVGFMGGFTTFSTFAFESAEMLMDSRWAWVVGNVLGQNVVGIALMFAGIAIGRAL